MPSVNTDTHIPDETDLHMYDVAAVLISEICTYLGIHDQENMKSVCKWWRLVLSETFLSRLVDLDSSRMLTQSEDFLEHTLSMHVQRNTKILVIRNILASRNAFGIIARVVKQKHADLIQLTLKDCEVQKECSAAAYYWMHPEHIEPFMVHGLIFAAKKLVLENYTMRDSLGGALMWFEQTMPCGIPVRRNRIKRVPIVIPRYEFDCTTPLQQQYYSFIMALNNNCPEVHPDIRKQVMLLYKSWIRRGALKIQWSSLGDIIKCMNEGVAAYFSEVDDNVTALRQLDPLTLNKLTLHALHCLYF